MAGDSIGVLFRVTNWGESHGRGIGAVVEGCPPGIPLSERDIQKDLDRRRPGQSALTSQRDEPDKVQILSGVYGGITTGAPISLMILSTDARKKDYASLKGLYRPGHADLTYDLKYGLRDPNGGGRSSARVTAGSVAAGAIGRKILSDIFGTQIIAYVRSIKDIDASIDPEKVTAQSVERSDVRCPDKEASARMAKLIEETKARGDSLGGVVECVIRGVPLGLGEPVYDKLDSDLAKACMSINATKGFEIGSGFDATKMLGSEHNDALYADKGSVRSRTNNSGGVLGGISNGMPIIFRVAFKPTSTIKMRQETVDTKGKSAEIEASGRHDPCVLPRAVPIVEAMAAIVMCDHYLRHRGQCGETIWQR